MLGKYGGESFAIIVSAGAAGLGCGESFRGAAFAAAGRPRGGRAKRGQPREQRGRVIKGPSTRWGWREGAGALTHGAWTEIGVGGPPLTPGEAQSRSRPAGGARSPPWSGRGRGATSRGRGRQREEEPAGSSCVLPALVFAVPLTLPTAPRAGRRCARHSWGRRGSESAQAKASADQWRSRGPVSWTVTRTGNLLTWVAPCPRRGSGRHRSQVPS